MQEAIALLIFVLVSGIMLTLHMNYQDRAKKNRSKPKAHTSARLLMTGPQFISEYYKKNSSPDPIEEYFVRMQPTFKFSEGAMSRYEMLPISLMAKMLKWSSENSLLERYLDDTLFGEAFNLPIAQYRPSKKVAKGIVLSTGNFYFKYTVHLIKVIRKLKSTLPVEVYYTGHDDLSEDRVKYLNRMPGVKAIDLAYLVNQKSLNLKTWDMKPFMMLVTSFSEVLLLDADVVFAQSPDSLFRDSGYKHTGVLFFPDRIMYTPFRKHGPDLIKSWVPQPHSVKLLTNNYMNARASYLAETGVLVWDKRRHFYSLLLTALYNYQDIRKKTIHPISHGEKEAFWISLEALSEKYEMMPLQPGNMGPLSDSYPKNGYTMCAGKMLHFDRDGQPYWWNDSILKGKKSENRAEPFGVFAQWAPEVGGWGPYMCLSAQLQPVPAGVQNMADDFKGLFEYDPLARNGP